jgi:hypothetical protein
MQATIEATVEDYHNQSCKIASCCFAQAGRFRDATARAASTASKASLKDKVFLPNKQWIGSRTSLVLDRISGRVTVRTCIHWLDDLDLELAARCSHDNVIDIVTI